MDSLTRAPAISYADARLLDAAFDYPLLTSPAHRIGFLNPVRMCVADGALSLEPAPRGWRMLFATLLGFGFLILIVYATAPPREPWNAMELIGRFFGCAMILLVFLAIRRVFGRTRRSTVPWLTMDPFTQTANLPRSGTCVLFNQVVRLQLVCPGPTDLPRLVKRGIPLTKECELQFVLKEGDRERTIGLLWCSRRQCRSLAIEISRRYGIPAAMVTRTALENWRIEPFDVQ